MPVTTKKTLPIDHPDVQRLIESIKKLPKIESLHGAVCKQWKRCGKANCKCAKGDLHGPYYYRFWYSEGKLRKSYIKKADVEETIAACRAYKEKGRKFREAINWARKNWRNLFDSSKGI